MTYNDALNEVGLWFLRPFNPKQADFRLRGWAGTGKTTMIGDIIKTVPFKLGIASPTHKASRVIREKVNQKVMTVHSLLGLRLNTNIANYDINNPNFDPQSTPKMVEYSGVIIDESSMIPAGLHGYILTLAIKYKIKVLFMGDPIQLPPVKERISLALMPRKYNFIELTEIFRQELGHPILEPLSLLRDDVINGTRKFLHLLKREPERREGLLGYKVFKGQAYLQKVIDMYKQPEYTSNINHIKYLAYSNDRIIDVNKFIRKSIIPNYETGILTTDDLTTAYNTILEGTLLSEVLINSDDYVIENVTPNESVSGFKGFSVTVRNIYTGVITSMFVLDHSDRSIIKFIFRLTELYMTAYRDRSKWKNYYEFKNSHLLMRKITIYPESKPNGLTVDRDLDYAYSSTIHKAQGSTYNHVFIDIRDVMKAQRREGIIFVNRLLYVALSRTKYTANLFI